MTKILNWLKLEPESQEILFNLKTGKWVRLMGQRQLSELRKRSGKRQVETLLKILRNGGWSG